jgi:hypothetical protein
MKGLYPVPSSIAAAEAQFEVGSAVELSALPNDDFVARWSAVAYLEPGLHPDGYECEDSGWPKDLRPYATEAWRRCDIGELSYDQLYCSYATWAGLCDRMDTHTAEEKELRERIANGDF